MSKCDCCCDSIYKLTSNEQNVERDIEYCNLINIHLYKKKYKTHKKKYIVIKYNTNNETKMTKKNIDKV